MDIVASKGHYDVLRLLSVEAMSYVEIGVREGGSLLSVISASSLTSLTLCDTWGTESGGTGRGNHDHISQLLKINNYTGNVAYLDKQSQTVDWSSLPNWDLANIDGSHLSNDAYMDMMSIWPKVNTMVVHDISFPSVWSAVIRFTSKVDLSSATCHCAFGDNSTLVVTKT